MLEILPVASIIQCQLVRSLDIAAETVRYDFYETDLAGGYVGDFPIVLSQIIAGLHLVHEAVLRLHQPVEIAAHLEGAHHPERIERKSLEELAVAARTRPEARDPAADGAGALRLKGRTHGIRRIDEGFIRLYLRKRLNAAARLLLGFSDPLLQIRLPAGTSRRYETREHGRTSCPHTQCASHVAPPDFFFGPACPPSSSMYR